MRVAVLGAGAIGAYVGAALARGGTDVTLIGRGAHLAAMRERGVQVFYLQDLLSEALAASDEGRKKLINIVASEYTVGWSLVDEVRDFLWKMKPDVLIMHPGPINRGVEIDSEIADCGRSVILEQVTNGLAVRMAVLFLVNGGKGPQEVAG